MRRECRAHRRGDNRTPVGPRHHHGHHDDHARRREEVRRRLGHEIWSEQRVLNLDAHDDLAVVQILSTQRAAASAGRRRENEGKVVVRKAERYSSEDVHRAVFAKRPKARKLDEFKQAIRRHAKGRRAGR